MTASDAAPVRPLRPVRVFVGLAVTPGIADELAKLAACLEGPSVRLIAASDVHLTLVPPWREAAIPAAVGKLRAAARAAGAFSLTFSHLGYGPQPRYPRLLWADCTAGEEIAVLRAALLQAYGRTDERPFRPHVTLARLRGNGRAIARSHPIDRDLSFTQRVESVELYRSPSPGESGYRIVASARLGDTGDVAPEA